MTTCATCAAPLAEGARFCRSCGASVENEPAERRPPAPAPGPDACGSCGAHIPASARFCRSCGAERSATGASPAPAGPDPSTLPSAEPVTAVLGAPPDAPLPRAPHPAPRVPPTAPGAPIVTGAPPGGGRSRAGFAALIAALVLVFGAVGGAAAYFLVLEPDDEPQSSAQPAGAALDDFGGPAAGSPASGDAGDEPAEDEPADDGGAGVVAADVSSADIESDASALLLDFHEAVVAGRYEDAWDQLSVRKQSQIEREDGYAAWSRAQGSLAPHLDPSGLVATIADLDRATGVARVMVEGMTWSKPGAGCSEWSGLTWVKYEDGGWRYDPGYSTTAARQRVWEPRFEELLGGSC